MEASSGYGCLGEEDSNEGGEVDLDKGIGGGGGDGEGRVGVSQYHSMIRPVTYTVISYSTCEVLEESPASLTNVGPVPFNVGPGPCEKQSAHTLHDTSKSTPSRHP